MCKCLSLVSGEYLTIPEEVFLILDAWAQPYLVPYLAPFQFILDPKVVRCIKIHLCQITVKLLKLFRGETSLALTMLMSFKL